MSKKNNKDKVCRQQHLIDDTTMSKMEIQIYTFVNKIIVFFLIESLLFTKLLHAFILETRGPSYDGPVSLQWLILGNLFKT